MATSTPTPADDPAPPPVESRQAMLTTIAEQVKAIDELIGLARHSVRVFDDDLSEMGWNSPARAEALGAFLRRSRNAKLDIIVHDTRWIAASGARLVNLLRTFGSAITIYRTGPEAQSASDPLIIVDDRHFLHRFHVERPRAALAIEEPQLARPLVDRFNEIWATGDSGLPATVLGL